MINVPAATSCRNTNVQTIHASLFFQIKNSLLISCWNNCFLFFFFKGRKINFIVVCKSIKSIIRGHFVSRYFNLQHSKSPLKGDYALISSLNLILLFLICGGLVYAYFDHCFNLIFLLRQILKYFLLKESGVLDRFSFSPWKNKQK